MFSCIAISEGSMLNCDSFFRLRLVAALMFKMSHSCDHHGQAMLFAIIN